MKILHIVGIGKLPRDPDREAAGGTTRVALELARLQAARGHRIVVVALARSGWRAEWRGVQLVALPSWTAANVRVAGRKLDLSALLPLFLWLAGRRFDVIHAHAFNYLRYLPAGVRITHFHNDPCRFPTSHEAGVWEVNECLAAGRYSHAHVAASDFVASQLTRRFKDIAAALPPGFDLPGRVHVLRGGLDLDRFDPELTHNERARYRSSWGVAEDDVVLLFSGATVAEKGVDRLIHAFARLGASEPRTLLVLAGHSTLWEDSESGGGLNEEHARFEADLAAALTDMIKDGRAIQMGLVSPAEMPGVYAAADVVVVPSTVQEALCLAGLEALAMGRPLVASAVGGVTEYANRDNSILVAAGDQDALFEALRIVTRNETLRHQLGQAARASVLEYSWDRAVTDLDRLYEELLARRNEIVCVEPPAFYRF
jgi:glycosyltransferase involved in cell wall biosynthesis